MTLRHALAFAASSTLVASCLLQGAGCAADQATSASAAESPHAATLSRGYSAIHSLLDDERNVDKILIIKAETEELKALVTRIANISGNAYDSLQPLTGASPPVRLDADQGLPMIEEAARRSIAMDTAMDLVFSDETFETRLLMSQGQALRYGHALATQLARQDGSPERKEWAISIARAYEALYKDVVDMLSQRAVASR